MYSNVQTIVYGPAYLDRVVRVDAPLRASPGSPPIDRGVDGRVLRPNSSDPWLTIRDAHSASLRIDLPGDWPGPLGTIELAGPVFDGAMLAHPHRARAIEWIDDLGGMGAGFAKALGGVLISALGRDDDIARRTVVEFLKREAIEHLPLRADHSATDWTLLISSGPHGDKLPIGFRGCHASMGAGQLPQPSSLISQAAERILLVVAGIANPIVAAVLDHWTEFAAKRGLPLTRFFAPTMRNVADRTNPIGSFAANIDALSCNRGEWNGMTPVDRASLESLVRWLAVTDGPGGAELSCRATNSTKLTRVHIPAHPRLHPPRDTNRAGEAFASEWLRFLTMRDNQAPCERDTLATIGRRAAAAASLTIDRPEFGFPTAEEIDHATTLPN